jgi:predicted dehydrogenase
MVGHTFLFSQYVHELKKIVDDEIGNVLYAHSQRTSFGPVRKDVDVIWNVGPHDISIFNYLFNAKPKYVSAIGSCYLQPGIADIITAKVKYSDSKDVYLYYSWFNPDRCRKITIVGDKKMVNYDDTNSVQPIAIYDKSCKDGKLHYGDDQFVTYKTGCTEPLRTEILHFVNCINDKLTPLTNGQNALDVISVLEAMSTSLEADGREVEVRHG